jgi:hypothetical protein
MTESARPDPEAPQRAPGQLATGLSKSALRVKDLAVDLATDVADGYRKSTRAFRLRLAVVGAWVVLSLATMWLACPRSGPSNSLGADVQVSEELLGTQILIWNSSGDMWTDVTLTLDGGWQWHTPTIREGQRLVVAASRFSKDGAAAPGDLKPRSLTIDCTQGKATTPFPARSP